MSTPYQLRNSEMIRTIPPIAATSRPVVVFSAMWSLLRANTEWWGWIASQFCRIAQTNASRLRTFPRSTPIYPHEPHGTQAFTLRNTRLHRRRGAACAARRTASSIKQGGNKYDNAVAEGKRLPATVREVRVLNDDEHQVARGLPRQGRAAELLGQLVRAVQGRVAGDRARLQQVQGPGLRRARCRRRRPLRGRQRVHRSRTS